MRRRKRPNDLVIGSDSIGVIDRPPGSVACVLTRTPPHRHLGQGPRRGPRAQPATSTSARERATGRGHRLSVSSPIDFSGLAPALIRRFDPPVRWVPNRVLRPFRLDSRPRYFLYTCGAPGFHAEANGVSRARPWETRGGDGGRGEGTSSHRPPGSTFHEGSVFVLSSHITPEKASRTLPPPPHRLRKRRRLQELAVGVEGQPTAGQEASFSSLQSVSRSTETGGGRGRLQRPHTSKSPSSVLRLETTT